MMVDNLPLEYVRRLFTLDAERGLLFWNRRPPEDFRDGKYPATRIAAIWNAKYAGKKAGCAVQFGYRAVALDGSHYMAHRLIWLHVTGSWPNGELDHIDGVEAGDMMSNLREVTHSENMKNTKLGSSNSSGNAGVTWFKQRNKWRAQIHLMNTGIHLGLFSEKADAIAARKAAEVKYGFHKNHGRDRSGLALTSEGPK